MRTMTSPYKNQILKENRALGFRDVLLLILFLVTICWILFILRINQPVMATLTPTIEVNRQKIYLN